MKQRGKSAHSPWAGHNILMSRETGLDISECGVRHGSTQTRGAAWVTVQHAAQAQVSRQGAQGLIATDTAMGYMGSSMPVIRIPEGTLQLPHT